MTVVYKNCGRILLTLRLGPNDELFPCIESGKQKAKYKAEWSSPRVEMIEWCYPENHQGEPAPECPESIDLHEVYIDKEVARDTCTAENPESGEKRIYSDNGTLLQIWRFRNGKQHGLYEVWWEDTGMKWQENEWRNGKEHGFHRYWHPNGRRAEVTFHNNGIPAGPATTWYENGKQRSVVPWNEGKYDGQEWFWFESGQPLRVTNWKDDKQHGLEEEFRENGSRRRLLNWYEDKKHGHEIHWGRDGKVCKEIVWEHGKQISIKNNGSL